MSRRGNGEGTIYKRRDGRWVAVVHVGWQGDRRQRKFYFGKTRHDVQERLKASLRAQQQGLPLSGERQTVAAYLTAWLDSARSTVRPRTWQRYEQYVRIHASPSIGRVPLSRLGPGDLQRLYAERLSAGSSAATVAHLHAVIHRALQQATRWGMLPRNVATLVDPPRAVRREMSALSPEQARALLAAAAGSRLEALYILAITTGMRQGELLGLRWSDVALDAAVLHVRASMQHSRDGFAFVEPKTARSRRQIEIGQAAIAALRRHRAAQLQERLQLGAAWQDLDLVFANEIGGPLDGSNIVNRSFRPLLQRAALPRIRFHDLRHTAATLLLGQGVHPKVVSERLGHSQIAVTLDLYSHVTPTMQKEAAAALDRVLA